MARITDVLVTLDHSSIPLERNSEEPFERQRAAPRWVEVQGEVEAAVTTFRAAVLHELIRLHENGTYKFWNDTVTTVNVTF